MKFTLLIIISLSILAGCNKRPATVPYSNIKINKNEYHLVSVNGNRYRLRFTGAHDVSLEMAQYAWLQRAINFCPNSKMKISGSESKVIDKKDIKTNLPSDEAVDLMQGIVNTTCTDDWVSCLVGTMLIDIFIKITYFEKEIKTSYPVIEGYITCENEM